MERCDVAVVGAGLAGLETARRLSHAGLDVVLVDRKTDLGRGIHTTGVFVRRSLEDFEFPPGTLGPPVRHVTLVSPRGRELDLASDREEFRVGRMAELYQDRLSAAQRAGVRWFPGCRLIGVEARDQFRSALRLERAGEPSLLEARYLVGADGATSAVAAGLDLDRNRELLIGIEEVLVGPGLSGPPRFWCVLDPVTAPGYLAWVIHDGVEVHLGAGGVSDRFSPQLALAAIRGRARRWLDLDRSEVRERRGGLIPVGGVLRRIVSPRGLLVGDAAGAPSPLTAGGLDPCLRLAALAAEVIPKWLATADPGQLARYDGRRFRARFASRLAMRHVFGALATTRAVEAAFALLRTRPGRAFAAQVFFGRGSFPDVGVPLGPRPPIPSVAGQRSG